MAFFIALCVIRSLTVCDIWFMIVWVIQYDHMHHTVYDSMCHTLYDRCTIQSMTIRGLRGTEICVRVPAGG